MLALAKLYHIINNMIYTKLKKYIIMIYTKIKKIYSKKIIMFKEINFFKQMNFMMNKMSNNTFTLQNIDRVNFYGNDSGADVYLEGVSTGGTSGVCVSGSLLVNGDYINFGSSLGAEGYGIGSSGGSIVVKNSGGGWTVITDIGGVSGANTQVQFNDNGSFGADPNFTWSSGTSTLTVKDTISVSNTSSPSIEKIKLNSTGQGACIRMGSTSADNPTITLNTVGNSSQAMITLEESAGVSVGLELGIEGSDFKGGIISMYETTQGISTLVISGGVSDSTNGYIGSSIEMKRRKNNGTSIITPFTFDAPNLEMVLRNDNSGASVSFGMSTSQTNATNFILPTDNGTINYVLRTDGNGITSWVAQSGGGSGGTPSGSNFDIQFNDEGSFGGVSALQFHKSTYSGVSALTVDGNVFSRGLSVVESGGSPGSVYNIPVENFVNGVVFPPYGTTGNEEHHVVKVPTLSNITASYNNVLKDGQFFETLIYGTSTGVSNGLSIPTDITVLSNTGVSFDTRLIKNRTPAYTGTGMSFHGATLWNGETYQGVVIKSRYTSTGVSMYPASTAFYN